MIRKTIKGKGRINETCDLEVQSVKIRAAWDLYLYSNSLMPLTLSILPSKARLLFLQQRKSPLCIPLPNIGSTQGQIASREAGPACYTGIATIVNPSSLSYAYLKYVPVDCTCTYFFTCVYAYTYIDLPIIFCASQSGRPNEGGTWLRIERCVFFNANSTFWKVQVAYSIATKKAGLIRQSRLRDRQNVTQND